MNDWQYLSLGDLQQNGFAKKILRFSRALTFNYGHVTRDQKLEIKEICELVANLLCLDNYKQIGISERR